MFGILMEKTKPCGPYEELSVQGWACHGGNSLLLGSMGLVKVSENPIMPLDPLAVALSPEGSHDNASHFI